MTPDQALTTFARAIVREILSFPSPVEAQKPRRIKRPPRSAPTTAEGAGAAPQPRFDFTIDSDAEFDRRLAEELDQLQGVESAAAKRAQRYREREYPEDLSMRGMAPPEE
jgi:hypothetical protein